MLILAKSSARLRNASCLHWFAWLVFFYSTSFWWPWIKYYYLFKVLKGKKTQRKTIDLWHRRNYTQFRWKTISDRKANVHTKYYTRTSVQSLYSLMRQAQLSLHINISSVVEFQRWWVLISKIFAMWWPGFKDFIWFFEMEEHGAWEASNYNWS